MHRNFGLGPNSDPSEERAKAVMSEYLSELNVSEVPVCLSYRTSPCPVAIQTQSVPSTASLYSIGVAVWAAQSKLYNEIQEMLIADSINFLIIL